MRAGSLQNLMYDTAISAEPTVGAGATIIMWTDRHAGTVIEISKSGHRIKIQEDTTTRTDSNGMSDAQSYEYAPNPDGKVWEATRRGDGSYRLVGLSTRVLLGTRRKYHDYGF